MHPDQLLQQARELHKVGKLAQAESLYRRILAEDPRHPAALHLMGLIADSTGHSADGVQMIRQSLSISPNAPAWFNLGLILLRQTQLPDAYEAFRSAVAINPRHHLALDKLGTVCLDLNRHDEAIAAFRAAVLVQPGFADARRHLGHCLQHQGNISAAIAEYRAAVVLEPNFAVGHAILAHALDELGQTAEALVEFQTAIRLDPGNARAHSNLASFLVGRGQLHDAIAEFQTALRLDPDLPQIHRNLGIAFTKQGDTGHAVEMFHAAMQRAPADPGAHSDFIYSLQFDGDKTPREIFDAHVEWNRLHAQPLARNILPHSNDRNPDRRRRIGYVSGDFRLHSAAFFLENLLANHDPHAVEIFCYSNNAKDDAVTIRFRKLAHHWRDIHRQPDAIVAQQIRSDAIDILVDLAGHTGGNRILLFALKPAPIQVAWLGYPDTTGLSTIDYRITDALADPPGLTDSLHTEKLIRLPRTFLCYSAPETAPPIAHQPAGPVTFGSFNHISKISDPVLQTWSRILAQIPDARLILKSPYSVDTAVPNVFASRLTAANIDPQRLQFLPGVPTLTEHLQAYNQIDIVLDTFPYNGTTTTCEALWMGVPVVTLAGQRHAGRVGVSLLTNIGHPEFIATTPDQYVQIAVDLANDHARRQSFRRKIRGDMAGSALCDAPEFARDVEATYRQMWQRWVVLP